MLVVFGEHDEARPVNDLTFAYSQLSKFVKYREWYICKLLLSECYNTYVVLMIQELLIVVTLELKSRSCVESDFGSDPDTRKSMTLYLASLMNDGAHDFLHFGPR
jgi:hypothetical protein